jgi:hypothetical protein
MSSTNNVWLINFELEQLRDYLDVLDDALKDYEQKLENYYTIDDLTDMDEEAEIRYDRYIDIFSSVLGDFPRRLYSSFVVSWYSFIEDAITQLCKDMDLMVTIRIQDQNNFRNGVYRAKRFLVEAANYTIDQGDYLELDIIRKMRNQIVHEGGKFQCSLEKPNEDVPAVFIAEQDPPLYLNIEKNLYLYLNKHSLLHFYGTFFINPTAEYGRYLIDFGTRFFHKIISELGLE